MTPEWTEGFLIGFPAGLLLGTFLLLRTLRRIKSSFEAIVYDKNDK